MIDRLRVLNEGQLLPNGPPAQYIPAPYCGQRCVLCRENTADHSRALLGSQQTTWIGLLAETEMPRDLSGFARAIPKSGQAESKVIP
jgi:hypothetical protein